MDYPVRLERDEQGRVVATFPDFAQSASALGEYEDDALHGAVQALVRSLGFCVARSQEIPSPSRRRGAPRVRVPALVEAKLIVYRTMRDAGVTRATLAKRLRWHRPQVDRLLDLAHASRLDQIEAALRVMGHDLAIGLEPLTPAARSSRLRT